MTAPCCIAEARAGLPPCGPQCLRGQPQLAITAADRCVCGCGTILTHDRVVGMIPPGILAQGAKPWASLNGCRYCGCTIFQPDDGWPKVRERAPEKRPPLLALPGEPWYQWYEQAQERAAK